MDKNDFWCKNCHAISGGASAQKDYTGYSGGTNGWAIAAIICVGLLGFIFAILGLLKSRNTGTGKVLSIVALVLSSIWVLAIIIVLANLDSLIGGTYYYYY